MRSARVALSTLRRAAVATVTVGGFALSGSDCEADKPRQIPAAAFAAKFDHTLLRQDATVQQVMDLCVEAHKYSFASVCVPPAFVSEARECLERLAVAYGGKRIVKVCTVIGFPLGFNSTEVKVFEANAAVDAGAEELDMVLPVGRLKNRSDIPFVTRDICAVAEVAHRRGVILKVILETALLDDDERDLAVFLAAQCGCHFVKTSTGFAKGGATVHDVEAMVKESRTAASTGVGVRGGMLVKASGGIRDCAQAMAMIDAGASRIGASASAAIFEECAAKGLLPGAESHARRAPAASSPASKSGDY
jgi:deoxyribose-phosphate aldolase